jgi:hypothetical protein
MRYSYYRGSFLNILKKSTTNVCRGEENVDLYIHCPILLQGVVFKHRDNFTLQWWIMIAANIYILVCAWVRKQSRNLI